MTPDGTPVSYPYAVPALRVIQPAGIYYVAVLPARVLLETAYSDRLRAVPSGGSDGYTVKGTQRELETVRLRAIAAYLNGFDAAFPNSIILAANQRDEDGMVEENEDLRWRIEAGPADCYRLVIPSAEKLAAVIDGQHRLFSFGLANADRLDMQLICSIIFDLPKPVQAQLFATINTNQVQVDKSMTFELFGYNVADEPEESWSPDKLAVYLARRLNADAASPLRGRIIIAAETEDISAGDHEEPRWRVSLATVVQGLLRLVSSNPKADRSYLALERGRVRGALSASGRKDPSPLRVYYLQGNDKLIYTLALNFLVAADRALWADAERDSYILRTVGIQAVLDVMRALAPQAIRDGAISVAYFERRLAPARDIDFSEETFRNASGAGRTRMRRILLASVGLLDPEELAPGDKERLLPL
ncbi:DGQHR domain-containing protein [Methylorubrum extorquens]|uniref:DGQHR domain-containing protein n=1 Tax=Methylorubrum extorquens TaxID=408 RepID=UPI001EE58A1E|nr:DGQHR domain-containing protein [Methylorubrum extorquens]MCG5248432.1 DGQHR domain-containing protein [Methylorubrum extorquens]